MPAGETETGSDSVERPLGFVTTIFHSPIETLGNTTELDETLPSSAFEVFSIPSIFSPVSVLTKTKVDSSVIRATSTGIVTGRLLFPSTVTFTSLRLTFGCKAFVIVKFSHSVHDASRPKKSYANTRYEYSPGAIENST